MLAGKSFAHRLPRLRVTTPMLAVVVALFLVSTGNNSFWSATASAAEISWRENFRFAVAIFVMLVAAFTLVIAPFGFRFLFKPVISGLLILAAVNSYFMDTYGVVIDAGMLRNTIETDPSEVDGLLSPVLFWHVLGAGVLPALVVYWLPVRYATFPKQLGRQLLTMTLALGVVGAALYSHYKEFSLVGRENRSLRYLINPTYSIYAAGKLLAAELSAGEVALRPLGRDAYQPPDRSPDGKPRLVVFVLGETVRAHNATFEGYERKTMPLMAQEEIVSFDSVYSCGTATAVSLPCMFSRQNRSSYDEFASDNRENLLDVLKHAGIRVLWRENNSGCKGVCARVKTQNTTQMTVPTYCNTDGCFDEILLYQLDKWLSESQGDTFVVLHQQGNHGPEYYKRYPPEFRKFRPECRSNRPQDCSRQDLINAYDNAILYTDFVLSQVLKVLKSKSDRYASAMIYMSDHGESLGESGIYLHGLPYLIAPHEQTHVPLMVWTSSDFRKGRGLERKCMRQMSDDEYSQDNLFDTVLGLFAVQTQVYRPGQDIFAACRAIALTGR